MRYLALATDYDETIAFDGRVDEPTVEALRRAKAAGLRLVLVTGRELTDLFNTFEHAGSLRANRCRERRRDLRSRDSVGRINFFVRPRLRSSRRWSVSSCHSRWATPLWRRLNRTEHQVLAAIHDLGLEWHVIFNKGSVMALPSDVTKATGLAPALAALQVPLDRTVGVGDAENDQAFLRMCGLAVAVDNALPAVKAIADVVTTEARGAGVRELIDGLLAGKFDTVVSRH